MVVVFWYFCILFYLYFVMLYFVAFVFCYICISAICILLHLYFGNLYFVLLYFVVFVFWIFYCILFCLYYGTMSRSQKRFLTYPNPNHKNIPLRPQNTKIGPKIGKWMMILISGADLVPVKLNPSRT